MGVGIKERERKREREMSSDQHARRFFPDSTHAHVAAGIPRRAEEDKRGWASVCTSVV